MKDHIENLKPGDFVVITGQRDNSATLPWFRRHDSHDQVLSGEPFEVLCIEMPFVVVANEHGTCAFDMRVYDLKKVSRRYVTAMIATRRKGKTHAPKMNSLIKQTTTKIEKPHPRDCPKCGARMRLRGKHDKKVGEMHYKMICPHCGFERPPEMAEL